MLNSGRRGKRSPDGYGILSVNEKFNQTNYPIPIIDSYAITDGSYNPIDDTALDTAGGQTVVIYGSGFTAGITVNINGSNVSPVTLLDSGRITFTAPALASASYTIYASNTDGATAIYVPGLIYSGLPTWSSPSAGSIGTSYETKSVSSLSSNTFIATGDGPITYSIYSGNLPSGVTLSSSGVLSGTLPVTASATTYSFTIRASDAQNQDSNRSFSLTINPDAVTWSTPSLNGTLTVYETKPFSTPLSATSAAGYGVMYSANTLPTGITLSNNTGAFTGYANTVGNTGVLLTATANTTGRSATSNVNFIVSQDVVTWSSPANNTTYAVNQGSTISSVPLSSTSAAGYGVQYTASALPTGVTLSDGTISGTPTTAGTTTTQLTATANTTNRSSVIYINWSVTVAADTYFANTVLLLSANSQTQTASFATDTSNSMLEFSVVGDVQSSNFNPFEDGYYSTYFNGANNYLTSGTTSAVTFGTGDYTIEFWCYANQISDALCLFATYKPDSSYSYVVRYSGTTGWQLYNPHGYMEYTFNSTNNALRKWCHFAIVRRATTLYWYLNGVQVGSTSATDNVTDNKIDIGNFSGYYWDGLISNFRVVKGTAVYTSAFTPPTAPLTAIANTVVLTCQSNRHVDSGSSNTSFSTTTTWPTISHYIPDTFTKPSTTYGSAYFDGTGDYLISTNTAAGAFGNKDFTIECWIYVPVTVPNNATIRPIISNIDSASNESQAWDLQYVSGAFKFTNIYAQDFITSSTAFTPNQWHHIAVTRSGTTWNIWLNGVSIGTTTGLSWNFTGQYPVCIGYNSGVSTWLGYISGVRVIKGTALYTSAFTPIRSLPTAVANTSLLTFTTNGSQNNKTFKEESVYNSSLFTRFGNVTTGTFSPYGDNWSNYFDGSSYFSMKDPSPVSTTGDLTVEYWINSATLYPGIPVCTATNATGAWLFENLSDNRIMFYHNNFSTGKITTSLQMVPNTWNHIALVRISGVFYIYINGVRDSNTYSSAGAFGVAGGIYVGTYANGLTNTTAHVSNFRIVYGTAVYSGTSFTVPTSPLVTVANTVLLTCQSNRFVDNANTNNTLVITGTPKAEKFSPFSLTSVSKYYSNYFNGTTDYLSLSGLTALGTSDFTIEMWAYLPSVGFNNGGCLFSMHTVGGNESSGVEIYMRPENDYYWRAGVNGVTFDFSTTTLTDKWNHIALVRSSGTGTFYVNGTSVATASISSNLTSTFGYIGTYATLRAKGYISNLRVVKGTAVYSSNFTPSTTPLTTISGTTLLTCQSASFVDKSNTNSTITPATTTVKPVVYSPFVPTTTSASYSPSTLGGSMFFDGTGDYLKSNYLDPIRFSDMNFTIEFWWYLTGALNDAFVILASKYNGTQFGDLDIRSDYVGATSTTFYICGGGADFSATYNGPLVNCWTHFAVVRNGLTVTFYVNGIRIGSGSAGTQGTTNFAAIGVGGGSGLPAAGYKCTNGYISDLRVIKGQALYTSNFVPSSTPLTLKENVPYGSVSSANTTATSLLLSGTSGGIVDQTRTINLETVGDTKVTRSGPYDGKYYSNYFSGGSCLTIGDGSTTAFQFGTGDFTVEFWLNTDTITSSGCFFNISPTAGSPYGMLLRYAGTTQHQFFIGDGSSWVVLAATFGLLTTYTPGTWYHYAVVRNSGVVKIYINGTEVYSVSDSTNMQYQYLRLGTYGGYHMNGNISNFRIVKGTAVYTSNFTPPTSTLTAISGTQVLTCQDNKFIDNSTNSFQITLANNPKIKSKNPFVVNNSQSYYFDGTGDYLYSPANIQTQIGTGDYTIEYWVNPDNFSAGTDLTHIHMGNLIIYTSSGALTVYGGVAGTTSLITGSTLTPGQWTHIAVTRKTGVGTTLWINGTRSGAVAVDSTSYTSALYIGMKSDITGAYLGHMTDVRITKNARYTSNNTTYLNSSSPYLNK